MKHQRTLRRVAVALMLLVAFLFQGTWALAGTTGRLSGTLTDKAGAPVVGAVIEANSPSQTAVAITDVQGHFEFLSLSPDTYTVTAKKAGYNTVSVSGVTVFADQGFTLSMVTEKALKTIATVKSTAAGNLVKPGSTSSVYSVNSATASILSGSGGGGNLQSAYSAIYQQPGVSSYIGNYGFGQVFFIRGGSYSQVGYEFDGVPVNRAFDNYSANSLSNLGTSETQVYTGGAPASATSATLGGYVNQVIKTGTYPGFGDASAIVAGPSVYRSLSVEAGGATPNRLFSYYVGLRGTTQGFRFLNNSSGDNYAFDGSNPYALTGPSIAPIWNSGFANYAPLVPGGAYQGAVGPFATCGPGGAPVGGSEALSPYANANFLGGVLSGGAPGAVPVCTAYGPISSTLGVGGNGSSIISRDTIINLNFAIPHKRDAGRDSVQLLFDNFAYHTIAYDNINAEGGLGYVNGLYSQFVGSGDAQNVYTGFGLPGSIASAPGAAGPYGNLCQFDAFQTGINLAFNGQISNAPCATGGYSVVPWGDGVQSGLTYGTPVAYNAAGANIAVPYYFPSSPMNRSEFTGISPNQVSGIWNNGSIVKLQYQRNINERSYFRIYGYTFYSDWLNNNPNAGSNGVFAGMLSLGSGGPANTAYELNTHTRGLTFNYANQINDKNLLSFDANVVASTAIRNNNRQAGAFNSFATNLVNSAGQCYSYQVNNNGRGKPIDFNYALNLPAGSQVSCISSLSQGNLLNATPGAVVGAAATSGAQWMVTAAKTNQLLNAVRPLFTTLALQDDFHPTRKLDLNLGVRYENFTYNFTPPSDPETTFWFNQFANDACVTPGTFQNARNSGGGLIYVPNMVAGETAGLCYNPASTAGNLIPLTQNGAQLVHANQTGYGVSPVTSQVHKTMSQRIAATYTIDPNTVLRFSWGRFIQPTETAFVTYLNNDGYQTANFTYSSAYFNNGFRTTVHPNHLQVSSNLDFSLEKHIKGTDITFRITPYMDTTRNQLVELVLGNLAGGINGSTRKTTGLEIGIQKGDPSRNGFSGFLGYTYTHARVQYVPVNGVTPLVSAQASLAQFFGFTKAGGGAPCYTPAPNFGNGTADPSCAAGDIANPYYNLNYGTSASAFIQSLAPTNGWYPTYTNFFPNSFTAIGLDQTTSLSPNAFTGYVSYKKNRFQASLNLDLQEGQRYGNPFAFTGIDPTTCIANQLTTGTGTTNACDYQTSQLTSTPGASFPGLVIPNPTTGQFDSYGQYRDPWQVNIGGQVSYQFNARVGATLTVANLVNRCFGGSKTPWSSAYPPGTIICGYSQNNGYLDYTPGATAYNTNGAGWYNGATPSANNSGNFPAWMQQAYVPNYNALPLQVYLQLNVKV